MTAPLCDLVLLSWNHLEETAPCLETLFRHTDVPSRLFIVDNGSEPTVREFLRAVKPHGAIQEVVLLQNETNEGFPRGMNRGLQASTAPFVCLLNNDLLMTPRWLSRLIEIAQAHPEIGVVNPASNTFGERPAQGQSIDDYAAALEAKRGRYIEVGMCIGFCLLISRAAAQRLGGLTEEVRKIFFEDEDFSMRAQLAGFQCVVGQASYVWHHEHRTVQKMTEREEIFQHNQRWCNERYGRRLRVAYPAFERLAPGSPELRRWLEQLVGWARQRTHVYVYASSDGSSRDELFRSVHLVPHADVQWRTIPPAAPRLGAAGAILARQRKRFDAIIAPDPGWAALMRGLSWIHRAPVIDAGDTERLTRLWASRFPSPSSS